MTTSVRCGGLEDCEYLPSSSAREERTFMIDKLDPDPSIAALIAQDRQRLTDLATLLEDGGCDRDDGPCSEQCDEFTEWCLPCMTGWLLQKLEAASALRAVRSPQGDEHEVSEMRDEGHPRHRTIRGDDLLVPQVQEDRQAAGNRLGAVRSPHQEQQKEQESETRVDGVPSVGHGDLPHRNTGDSSAPVPEKKSK